MRDLITFLIDLIVFPGFCIGALISGYRKLKRLRYAIDHRVVEELEKFRKEMARGYRRWRRYLCAYTVASVIAGTSWYTRIVHNAEPLYIAGFVVVGCMYALMVTLFAISMKLLEEKQGFKQLDLYIKNMVGKQVVVDSFYKPYLLHEVSCILIFFSTAIAIIVLDIPS